MSYRRLRRRLSWVQASPNFAFIGQGLHFWELASNRFGVPKEWAQRMIIVKAVVRMMDVGISPESIKEDPLQRWGCWRIDGVDVITDEPVAVFWEAMYHGQAMPWPRYQLAHRDKVTGSMRWIGRSYAPNRRSRLLMRDALLKLEAAGRASWEGFELAAFPVVERMGHKRKRGGP